MLPVSVSESPNMKNACGHVKELDSNNRVAFAGKSAMIILLEEFVI
jgi:hypothetical protein